MNHGIDDKKQVHQLVRRKLLGLFGLTLLVGCDNMFGKQKEKSMIDPEHGKTIERNGQKYRVFLAGGIRFVAPDSHQVIPRESGDFDMNMFWPNIPPDKAPDTKFTESLPDSVGNRTTNMVTVVVRTAPGQVASFDSYPAWTSPDLIAHDDLDLGLRVFIHKNATKSQIENGFYNEAYSLDVRTPYSKEPVILGSGLISFMYTKNIYVRLSMHGWSTKMNPDWEGIYLGVVETLNNYQPA